MTAPFDQPSSLRAGLHCRCPRCGEGKLFQGFLKLNDNCPVCRQSFAFADPADGPAFFVMTGIGILVIAVWTYWVLAMTPPIWLQFAVVFPALLIGCLGCLRPVKAWLVAEQFIHKAEEGQVAHPGAHGEGGFCLDRRLESERAARRR
jgi:uncharacterized protein (DUF983 family)